MAKIIILLLIFISYAAVLNARAGYKGKGNESTVLNGSGRRTKGGQSDYRSTSSQIADVTNADPLLEQVDYNPKRVPRGADDGPHSVNNYRHARPEDPHGYFTTPKNLRRNPKDMLNIPAKNVSDKETVLVQNPLYPINESSYGAYAVMLLALILFAVGIVGNLALMCTVWHNYYLKTVWNSILASLAFWDFLVLFFCLPVVVFNELTTKRLLGNISCRIVPYMEVTSLGVATFSLCALSIDRFYAVTSPRRLQISQVEPCQSILSKLSVIWVGSLVLAVPELLLWQLTQEYVGSSLATQNGSPTSMMGFQESQSETSTLAVLRPQNSAFFVDMCVRQPSLDLPETVYSLVLTYHEARMWWYFGCYFCLPLLFTLACNLVTWHVATQHTPEKSTVANGDHSLTSSSSSSTKIKQHVKREQSLSSAVTAFAVVYAVCNLPENACNITLAYISIPMTVGTKALLALIGQFLLFLRCSVTPVFLLCLCRSLGQAFIDCCCCCCEECLHDRTSSPSLLSASTTGTSASPYSISPHLPPSPCSTPSSNKDNKEKLTVVSGTPGTDCERKAGSSPVVARVTSC